MELIKKSKAKTNNPREEDRDEELEGGWYFPQVTEAADDGDEELH